MSVLPLDAADEVATEPVPPTARRGVPAWLRRPGAVVAVIWLVFLVVASFTAPLWRPYDVAAQDLANRLQGPTAAHWLGTDPNGRDILSRIFSAHRSTQYGFTLSSSYSSVWIYIPRCRCTANFPRVPSPPYPVSPMVPRTSPALMRSPTL